MWVCFRDCIFASSLRVSGEGLFPRGCVGPGNLSIFRDPSIHCDHLADGSLIANDVVSEVVVGIDAR